MVDFYALKPKDPVIDILALPVPWSQDLKLLSEGTTAEFLLSPL
jgi:hypothetical protein